MDKYSNYIVYVNVFYIDGRKIVRGVFTVTRYQAAKCVPTIFRLHTTTVRIRLFRYVYALFDQYSLRCKWEMNDQNLSTSSKRFLVPTKSIRIQYTLNICVAQSYNKIIWQVTDHTYNKAPFMNTELASRMAVETIVALVDSNCLSLTVPAFGAFSCLGFSQDTVRPSTLRRAAALYKVMTRGVSILTKVNFIKLYIAVSALLGMQEI